MSAYRTGRGFLSSGNAKVMKYQEAVGRDAGSGGGMLGWDTMRSGMSGSMSARWGGATTNFDWRGVSGMPISPRTQHKQAKPGRPKGTKVLGPNSPYAGGIQPMRYDEPGPLTNQSHAEDARGEFSALPSDQSKSGMASDSPVWSAGAQPLGYAGDAARPAAHSAALPSHPLGTALPWAPGRGVGSPAKTSVYPASFLPRGNNFDSTNDAGTWPASDAATGGVNDSSIYPSTGTVGGGSDSSIWPSTADKSAAPGADSTRRRAGMNQVALNQIGVVRRSGGWPG
jgi:hypothetical protein